MSEESIDVDAALKQEQQYSLQLNKVHEAENLLITPIYL